MQSKKGACMKKIVFLGICLCIVLLIAFSSVEAATPSEAAESTRGQQVKPKQIKMDRNYDGKIDRIETYTVEGVIIKAETDTNGDTKIDEWVFYEKARPVRAEKDTNGDGQPDTWMEY